MAAVSKKKTTEEQPVEIDVIALLQGEATFHLLGTSPLVMNRMAEKSRRTLLFPSGPLTRAEKQVKLKHDPVREFQSSVYRRAVHDKGPTRLLFPAAAFKRAIANTALDMPGVAKAKIDRLTWAMGHRVDIYGVPQMLTDVVRNRDIARTPDIHSWAITFPWAAAVTFRWVEPLLSEKIIGRLLANAGQITGIGDGRQEKGHFSRGQWILVNRDDKAFQDVIKSGGMKAQDEALENPTFYDADTEDLVEWFEGEYARRAQNLKAGTEQEDESDIEDNDLAAE